MMSATYRQAERPAPVVDEEDRILHDADLGETGRSNFAAFLLGGVVVAGGLMAFLYYDNGIANRGDEITTGSLAKPPVTVAPNIDVPSRTPGAPR